MSEQQRTPAKHICPVCGQANVVPVLYGMPTYEAFQQSQRGAFALGGCVVSEEDPRWECLECQERFIALSDDHARS